MFKNLNESYREAADDRQFFLTRLRIQLDKSNGQIEPGVAQKFSVEFVRSLFKGLSLRFDGRNPAILLNEPPDLSELSIARKLELKYLQSISAALENAKADNFEPLANILITESELHARKALDSQRTFNEDNSESLATLAFILNPKLIEEPNPTRVNL